MKFLFKDKVQVEVETQMAKGEVEMNSSLSRGSSRRLNGKSLLTFTSLLAAMVTLPSMADVQFDGHLWGFKKVKNEWQSVDLHMTEAAREKLTQERENAIEVLSPLDNVPTAEKIEKAFSKFVAKDVKQVNQFTMLAEVLTDAFAKKAANVEGDAALKTEKLDELVKAITDAIADKPEAFGKHWDRVEGKSVFNRDGLKLLVTEIAKMLKENEFPSDEDQLNKLLEELLKNPELLEKLGLSKKKVTTPKEDPKDAQDGDKTDGEKTDGEKTDGEKTDGDKTDGGKTDGKGSNAQNGNSTGSTPFTPQSTEFPGVNCAPNNQNDLVTKFLMDNLANLARAQRQADPLQELQGLANALNPNRNQDQGQQAQPAQTPFQPTQPEQRREEAPEESLARDTQPQQQPDPSFADPGVPPMFLNGGVRKPEYKKVAEDGTKEKNDLSTEIANAKTADKKADNFLTTGLQSLSQGVFLPNGQLNTWGMFNALGQISSMESKLRSQANNLKSSLDWAKTRRDALAKEIKKANPEFARLEEAEKTLKELTNAEQTLTQALQTKSSQCNSARLQEERQACESAKSSITNSLQQIKSKANEQKDLIAKSDKNFEEGYVADLKENLTQLEANIKSGEARLSDVEEKADKVAQQGQQLQLNAQNSMASTQTSGATARSQAVLTSGRRTPSGFGAAMGAGANTLSGGTGRGSYAPGTRGRI